MADTFLGYVIHGLPVRSTLRFEDLTPVDPASLVDPVTVEFGEAPDRLDAPLLDEPLRQVADGAYLRWLPGAARLWVTDGRRIVVQPELGCAPRTLQHVVAYIGVAQAGFQRGCLPLHASMVVAGSGAVAFAGRSGDGKSTLAAALALRGYAWFGDDLCLARLGADAIRAGRGTPSLRLCEDVAGFLGGAYREAEGMRHDDGKRSFLPVGACEAEDLPLRRIYLPRALNPGEAARIRPLDPVDALAPLIESMRLVPTMLIASAADRTFNALVQLANRIELFWFERPMQFQVFDAALDLLEAHLAPLRGNVD
jgi:hypothetical protein